MILLTKFKLESKLNYQQGRLIKNVKNNMLINPSN